MSFPVRHLCLAILLLAAIPLAVRADDWKPAPGNPVTQWAAKVDPKCPLPEYPRPQMVRGNAWMNLNGLWDYAITNRDAAKPEKFAGQILVPYCVESALSGVKKPLTDKQWLWYRRSFKSPWLGEGKRLLLHFGAVDWEAVVSVNGKEVGMHRGGYDPFTFDITDAVKPKPKDENELVVRVWDSTGGNGSPHGKQSFGAITHPGGIFYTPCSGIWQTVWTEVVPTQHIESLMVVPDVDTGTIRIAVNCLGDKMLKYEVYDGDQRRADKQCASGGFIDGAAGAGENRLSVPPVKIPDAKLWSPDTPFLYSLRLRYGDDTVDCYFAMRKISLGKDEKGVTRLMLNNKFVFQAGPLDQGFWPDGIYTAPTDEALKSDIETMKKYGMNMVRKHVKVEPERWYYWCDKLGLLVWQDMPAGDSGASPKRTEQFEKELKAMIETHRNHPSIVMWVVFNEGWGEYDTERLSKWVKELDPSRLVDDASGWTDRGAGDVIDMHNYPGPGSPKPEANRAAVLGEFGGLGLAIDGHRWVKKNWGYRGMADQKELTRKYVELWKNVRKLRDEKGLSAAVYTQLTDVETECNGLMTYDRAVDKVDPQAASEAATATRR